MHGAIRSTSSSRSKTSPGGAGTVIELLMSTDRFLSVHDPLALRPVDRDVGAVDEARPRGGDERDQAGDLLRLAEAAERDAVHRELVRLVLGDALVARERLLQGVPAVGVDGARVDRVHADAVAAVLLGQGRGEVD